MVVSRELSIERCRAAPSQCPPCHGSIEGSPRRRCANRYSWCFFGRHTGVATTRLSHAENLARSRISILREMKGGARFRL